MTWRANLFGGHLRPRRDSWSREILRHPGHRRDARAPVATPADARGIVRRPAGVLRLCGQRSRSQHKHGHQRQHNTSDDLYHGPLPSHTSSVSMCKTLRRSSCHVNATFSRIHGSAGPPEDESEAREGVPGGISTCAYAGKQVRYHPVDGVLTTAAPLTWEALGNGLRTTDSYGPPAARLSWSPKFGQVVKSGSCS